MLTAEAAAKPACATHRHGDRAKQRLPWGLTLLLERASQSPRQKRPTFSKKSPTFLEKRWTFSEKRGSFFSIPSERRFLTSDRNTNKAGNGRAASLEVQPLIARIDHFQAWTHNYNITRARRKFTQQRRR